MCKNETKIYHPKESTLIKATQLMKCFSLDFKGPVLSANSNNYLLIVADEFLRFFIFPCKNTALSNVIKCLEKLFTFTGIPSYIHIENAAFFASREFKQYLLKPGSLAVNQAFTILGKRQYCDGGM